MTCQPRLWPWSPHKLSPKQQPSHPMDDDLVGRLVGPLGCPTWGFEVATKCFLGMGCSSHRSHETTSYLIDRVDANDTMLGYITMCHDWFRLRWRWTSGNHTKETSNVCLVVFNVFDCAQYLGRFSFPFTSIFWKTCSPEHRAISEAAAASGCDLPCACWCMTCWNPCPGRKKSGTPHDSNDLWRM